MSKPLTEAERKALRLERAIADEEIAVRSKLLLIREFFSVGSKIIYRGGSTPAYTVSRIDADGTVRLVPPPEFTDRPKILASDLGCFLLQDEEGMAKVRKRTKGHD